MAVFPKSKSCLPTFLIFRAHLHIQNNLLHQKKQILHSKLLYCDEFDGKNLIKFD